MGRLATIDMIEHAGGEVALRYHLLYNHYPPPPESMIDVAREAIHNAASECWDKMIDLPDGIEHRVHGNQVPTSEVIDAFHLHEFLSYEDY